MDQKMALNWVYENIEAFGGDPKRVTIFGGSTGAGSVSGQLLHSPESHLFQRAILQSGTMFASSAMIELNVSRAIDANKQVASIVGCETESSTEMVECLRNASVDALLDAQIKVDELFEVPQRYTVFYPVVDRKFIPDVPEYLVERGEFNKVDILLGVNENEGISWLRNIYSREEINAEEAPFMNRTFFEDLLEESFPNYNKLYIDSLEQEYTDWKYSGYQDYNYLQQWAKISTDEFFQCPTDVTARAYAAAGKNVFRYVNAHVPSRGVGGRAEPEWYGVSHLQEGPFVFGWEFNTLLDPPFTQTKEEVLMSLEVMRYWTNFAKTGNPNMAEVNETNVAEPWPLFTVPGLEYKELSPEMNNSRAADARACSFWASYLPKVALFTNDLEDLEEDWRNSYYDWKNVALNEWQTAFDEYKKVAEPCT
ncbi:cholinesterase-like isoform X3 [Anneissia japonica]|nr:cholinesterase-like isoform X3 [Anneissia japonica]